MTSGWFAVGAVVGALSVMLGAFGAHGIKDRVSADLLAVYETAARYQMIHALALLAVGWLATRSPGSWVHASGWLFLGGVVVFSGSLYLMTLTGARWLGAVTPLGGLCLILGWLCLAVAALRQPLP